MFSSDHVDAGTQLLLAVFSRILHDFYLANSVGSPKTKDAAAGNLPPMRVLDAGCGVGVIGICVASAIAALRGGNGSLSEESVYVRCQDRDELARLVTLRNAAQNRIPPQMLEARAEPLLAGPDDERWDLILTNIPAKAGAPVLEDFVRRSACLLSSGGPANPGGRVIMVAVRPLADFFREQIAGSGAELFLEKQGTGHSVFVYGRKSQQAAQTAEPVNPGPGFFTRYPFYVRAAAACRIEDIPVSIATVHGASGFDDPGGAVLAAAKLARRIGQQTLLAAGANASGVPPLLIHEPGQGFFPLWLLEFLRGGRGRPPEHPLVLSGRNILALEAARHNAAAWYDAAAREGAVTVVPAADLQLGRTALLEAAGSPAGAGGRRYPLIAAFPELLPQSAHRSASRTVSKAAKGSAGADQLAALWESLPPLLAEGGIFIAAFSSSDAERFDRKKPAGFTRLGSVKRKGFRALAYRNREEARLNQNSANSSKPPSSDGYSKPKPKSQRWRIW